jgi:hypothetical protein
MEVRKPNHQHTARVRFLYLHSSNFCPPSLHQICEINLDFTFQQQLAEYDFQFSSWPVDFHWNESEDSLDRKKFEKIYDRARASTSIFKRIFSLPLRLARYSIDRI